MTISMTKFVCLIMMCFLLGCQEQPTMIGKDIYNIRHAKDLLRAAIEEGIKDPDKGREALKQFLLTEDQVKSLFRADVGPALALYYREVIVPQFLEQAPIELGSLYQAGHTYLKYLGVATNSSIGNYPGDLKLLAAFKEKPSLYGLRLMIPKAEHGLRLNSWFLYQDRWVTLLKTGELLEPWMAETLQKYQMKAQANQKAQ